MRHLRGRAERPTAGDTRRVPAEVRGVAKRFGATDALRGVSLTLGQTELLALLGPNGAGKTTLVSILVGLRRPDRGTVRIFGGDPRAPATRRMIGVTRQDAGFPPTLRVDEIVDLVRAHFPNPLPASDLLERFGLVSVARRQAGGLSGGERRRLAVALAFAGRPSALFLDEPTAGLDVETRRAVWGEIRRHVASGGAVLLTSHQFDEVEALATRVIVIDRGLFVVEGSVAEIRRRVGLTRVRFDAPGLPQLPGVADLQREGTTCRIYTREADRLVTALARSGTPFSNLEVAPVSLEEAFVAMTREWA